MRHLPVWRCDSLFGQMYLVKEIVISQLSTFSFTVLPLIFNKGKHLCRTICETPNGDVDLCRLPDMRAHNEF